MVYNEKEIYGGNHGSLTNYFDRNEEKFIMNAQAKAKFTVISIIIMVV